VADLLEPVVSLRTSVIDARAGYEEGATLTEDQQTRAVLIGLRDLHTRHIDELTVALTARGVTEPEDGSLMTTVHKAILNLRALFTGLNDNILPGVIDGEERIIEDYRDAVADTAEDRVLSDLLTVQCQRLQDEVRRLRALAQAA